MVDFIRTLFGIRKKRTPLPSSGSPRPGTTIVRRNLEIKVAQPVTAELWDWLLLSGWRVNPVKNDRRRYVRLPTDALNRLLSADNDARAKVHAQLVNGASRVGRRH